MSRRLVVSLLFFILMTVVGCGSSKPHSARQPGEEPAAGIGHPHYRDPRNPQPRHLRESLASAVPVGVSATPAGTGQAGGPPTPAGGWHVAFADGFGAPLGAEAGQDHAWKADSRDKGCCNNSNEINAERASQVRVGASGLELLCEKREVVSGEKYTCGGVSGYSESDPSGYRTPKIEWRGETIAFEVRAKLPPANGAADPGVLWADGPPWTDQEFDVPEDWGYGSNCHRPSWEGCTGGFVLFGSPHPDMEFHPAIVAEGFHTVDTVFTPTSSGRYRYRVYVDGKQIELSSSLESWRWVLQSPEVTPDPVTKDALISTYAMRTCSGCTKTDFTSNALVVRSIAVYVDGNHAGESQGVVKQGVATGTTIGSSSEPTPTETTPTPPPTTETTPTPPPPATPAVPTGCKAEGFLEGTTRKTRASCNTPPSGVSIEWQRTGPWTCAAQASPRYPIWTTGNPITNGLCVEASKRYDWSARAHSSSGTSAWTTPIPAYTP